MCNIKKIYAWKQKVLEYLLELHATYMQLKTRSMGIEITLFIVPKKGPHKILKYPDSPVPVYQYTPYAHLIHYIPEYFGFKNTFIIQ